MNYQKNTADQKLLQQLDYKKQIVKQQQTKIKALEQQLRRKNREIERLKQDGDMMEDNHEEMVENMESKYVRLQETNSILEIEIKELGQSLVYFQKKIEDDKQQHEKQIAGLKDELEINKSDYASKVRNLQASVSILKKNFGVDEKLQKDKQQAIRDSIKQKDGSMKGIILHNQQLANQLQSQSQQVVIMLQKIQKTQQHVIRLKRQIQIQKQVQSGLVKRSNAAQNLVRQLHQKRKQLQLQNQQLKKSILQSKTSTPIPSYASTSSLQQQHQFQYTNYQNQISQSYLQISKLRNQVNYLNNKVRLHQTKFQGLSSILSQYLQHLLLGNKNIGIFGISSDKPFQLNISQLKSKEIIEWKPQQTSAVVYFLLTQIKSIISKKNLITLPDLKNPNVSIIDQPISKQAINLPKLSNQYDEIVGIQHKRPSRFKGIPLDISTKIVRSELRNWGAKVGNNKKNNKSLSLYSRNPLI